MIEILSQSETSMIATRGVKILRLLLSLEQDRGKESSGLNIRGLVKYICENEALTSRSDEWQPVREPLVTGPPSPVSTMQPPGFLSREPHAEELYGNIHLPNSRFGVPDSLEDILLLVQNGGV